MHGIEQRIKKRWVPRLSAPPGPISPPWDHCLAAHLQTFYLMEPVARNGLSLTRNGCSLSGASIPESLVPACYFATRQLVSPPGPPPAWLPSTGLPRLMAASSLSARCGSPRQACSAASSASTPLRDFYLPRDRSVQQIPPLRGSPSESARFPLAPRRRSISRVGCGSPFLDSLRFRRLAVPQTSWNLPQYALKLFLRQRLSRASQHDFLNIYLPYFELVTIRTRRIHCG